MAKKLYVGNLPWSIKDSDLEQLFAEFGTISSASVITDKFSGRSKGFGFVEFADDAAADAAISTMDGKEVEGRNIVVNEARPSKFEGGDAPAPVAAPAAPATEEETPSEDVSDDNEEDELEEAA